ncbi:hypothetical protein D9M68_950020 [compost metagenome]
MEMCGPQGFTSTLTGSTQQADPVLVQIAIGDHLPRPDIFHGEQPLLMEKIEPSGTWIARLAVKRYQTVAAGLTQLNQRIVHARQQRVLGVGIAELFT